eukprot:1194032-Prorocentrum_minimum.AAC.5
MERPVEGFSDDEDAPQPVVWGASSSGVGGASSSGIGGASSSGVESASSSGVGAATGAGEQGDALDDTAPISVLSQLNDLQADARKCINRLDKISRNLKNAHKLPKQEERGTNYPSQIYDRMASLGNIESQIEFARQDLERRKQASVDEKKRFQDIESSIRKRDDHVKRLEGLLKEVPDDADCTLN